MLRTKNNTKIEYTKNIKNMAPLSQDGGSISLMDHKTDTLSEEIASSSNI